jgi:hypothetical protein
MQHRFLSRPHRFNVGLVVRVAHDAACEECGIHIPLYNARPVTQHMPPLTERLLCANAGGVVILRQLSFNNDNCATLSHIWNAANELTAEFCSLRLPDIGMQHRCLTFVYIV